MATTPVYGLRYQGSTDAPHGPNLGQHLAEDVEAELARIDAAKASLDGSLAALFSSALAAGVQATGSTTYVDMAGSPLVTKTTGSSALIIVTCFVFNNTAGAINYMSYAVSGATTLAASDDRALILHSEILNGQNRASAVHLQTGLTPGSNTFTAKYRVNAGTGTYSNRSLIVVAL